MEQSLHTWLMESCHLNEGRTNYVVDLLAKDGIDSLSALNTVVQDLPNFLCETPLPKALQNRIEKKLSELNSSKLFSLSVSDVQLLVDNMFRDKQYGSQFQNKDINGFVLMTVQSADKFKEWGELSSIHADTLFFWVQDWKVQGVPNHMLTSCQGERVARDVKREPASHLSADSAQPNWEQLSQCLTSSVANFTPIQSANGNQLDILSATPAPSLDPSPSSTVLAPRKRCAQNAGLDDAIVLPISGRTYSVPKEVKQASMALNSAPKIRKLSKPASAEKTAEQVGHVELPQELATSVMDVDSSWVDENSVSNSTAGVTSAALVPVPITAAFEQQMAAFDDAGDCSIEDKTAESVQSSLDGKPRGGSGGGDSSSDRDGDSDSSDNSSDMFDFSSDSEGEKSSNEDDDGGSDASVSRTGNLRAESKRKSTPRSAQKATRNPTSSRRISPPSSSLPAAAAAAAGMVTRRTSPVEVKRKGARELVALFKDNRKKTRLSASSAHSKLAKNATPAGAKKAKRVSGASKSSKSSSSGGGSECSGSGSSSEFSRVDSKSEIAKEMRRNLQMLASTDSDKQLEALKFFSVHASKYPEEIKIIKNVGATDKLIEMVSTPENYDEMNLWKTLVALNNIAATTDADYMISNNLVPTVVPLFHHVSKRVRLQALWLVGNIAVSEAETATAKTTVLTPDLVNAIVESFATRATVEDNTIDVLEFRYAVTIQQIVNAKKRPASVRSLFGQFIPVLCDIFRSYDNLEGSKCVKDSFVALLHYEPSSTRASMLEQGMVDAIIARLKSSSKVTYVANALDVLLALADCCDAPQLEKLVPVVVWVRRIVNEGGDKESKRMTTAIQFLIILCRQRIPGAMGILLGRSSASLYEKLASLIIPLRETQNVKGELAQASAELLACLALVADSIPLMLMFDHSLYSALFNALDLFEEKEERLVKVIIDALMRVVVKATNIGVIQRDEEVQQTFRAASAWEVVKRAASYKAQDSPHKAAIQKLYKDLFRLGKQYDLVVKA